MPPVPAPSGHRRRPSSRPLWLLALIAPLLGISPAEAQAQDLPEGVRIRTTDCPDGVELPGVDLTCGVLTVPEDYDQPSGRRLQLPYVLWPAPNQPAAADPVVFLGGGPGASPILRTIARGVEARLADDNRDLILVEYRGGGIASPRLTCPGVTDQIDIDPTPERSALRRCASSLAARNLDIGQYRPAMMARDIRSLRLALGIERWNVFALSFGTEVAAQLLREDPRGVRRLLMDSATPSFTNQIRSDLVALLDALTLVDRRCAQQPRCRNQVGDFGTLFRNTFRALEARPLEIPEAQQLDLLFGTPELDGTGLILLVQTLLDSREAQAFVPAVVQAASERDVAALLVALQARPRFPLTPSRAGQLAAASYSPVQVQASGCGKLVGTGPLQGPYVTRERWPAPIIAAVEDLNFGRPCRFLDVPAVPQAESLLVESRVPTLLVAGEWDTLTPPSQSRIAAAGLTRSRLVVVPSLGHNLQRFIPNCMRRLGETFFDGREGGPDTRCVEALPETRFQFPQ